MLTISATDAWRAAYPGAVIGVLEISSVANDRRCPRLDERKRQIEAQLTERYGHLTRRQLLALPVMAAYDAYYKRFKKTYHVQLQVESIVWKGKTLPSVSPAVDANFAAEVETFVLTAGHDVDRLRGPLLIDVSRAGDRMVQMGGGPKDLRPGDMVMRDARGISCSIIYGQDDESPITPRSTHVVYVAYGPAGVAAEQVEAQMRRLEENVRLCSAAAVVEQSRLLRADEER